MTSDQIPGATMRRTALTEMLVNDPAAILSRRKYAVIDQIQTINRGSDRAWLACFETDDLERYLAHLQRSLEPRGPHSVWVRPGDTAAIVQRIPAA